MIKHILPFPSPQKRWDGRRSEKRPIITCPFWRACQSQARNGPLDLCWYLPVNISPLDIYIYIQIISIYTLHIYIYIWYYIWIPLDIPILFFHVPFALDLLGYSDVRRSILAHSRFTEWIDNSWKPGWIIE